MIFIKNKSMSDVKFTHLHVHTQYSLLDGAASIDRLLQKCVDVGMDSIAMTDHGNMYGILEFVEKAHSYNIKPIIGCEFYMAKESRFDQTDKQHYYHQILLAKNELGYKNLSHLSSLSFIEGYYYKPRIDKDILREHHDGLIATTACMSGFVNRALLSDGEVEAEKELLEFYDIFGEDFYLELQRFGNAAQERCNQFLLRMSHKYNIKVVATNDVHYVNPEESISHDILLCIQTGSNYTDPGRMRFCSDTFYLKTAEEMLTAFQDIPEAVYNTQEIVDKCWEPDLTRSVLLPQYDIPVGFSSQDDFLKNMAYEGLHKRFNEVIPSYEDRIEYELTVIKKMGFAGYFLIVQDYINAARNMGVAVGPGRGSVAGSLVAYCIGITDVNPLEYGLFFERFLNPERISMPDIDVDFEDNGRDKVIDYVVRKYGKDNVAHLITYSTMAAKVAIKDVARVLGMSFEEANKITKLIPFKIIPDPLSEMIKTIPELKEMYSYENSIEHNILKHASVLEGCKRQTGIHACGIIISPNKLIDCLPMKMEKDSELLITQYEGSLIEHIGMLKMDFLGLKTLTIIKNTLKFVKKNRNVDVKIEEISFTDKKTLDIFRKGDTIGVFQFESEGMRAWLKKLRPDNMEDIIAMNSLFRPGPMQFIDDFIKRKHGKEKIEYPHPLLEGILKNTYGIIVYQEQVMQVAQIMAGYTLAQADILRKAMGKKKPEEMARQKQVFVDGCKRTNNIDEDKALEIFTMMETFAQYGFNKAHSAAYSVIAFQTAYLKAHYPVEFMAASLINAQTDIGALTPLMHACQKMGIKIKGPDINKSSYDFDITSNNEILYGLSGIKGVGDAATTCIITTRERHGYFKDIFDFVENVDMRVINKKTLESLALSGAFDSLNSGNRRQYVYIEDDMSFIEKLINYVSRIKVNKERFSNSLFGDFLDDDVFIQERPTIPQCQEYQHDEILRLEKDLIGFYISGHPLERYRAIIDRYCNCYSKDINKSIDELGEDDNINHEKTIIIGNIATVKKKQTRNNTTYGIVTIEDFYGEVTFSLFGKVFQESEPLLKEGNVIVCLGTIGTKYNDFDKYEFKCKRIFNIDYVMKHAQK